MPLLSQAQNQTLTICMQILIKHRAVLLYESTGSGKTYVACALAKQLFQNSQTQTYVIAPAHLIPNWKLVLKAFGLDCPCFSYQAASLGNIPYAIPPDALWIIDEAHMLKNPATKRYRHIKYLTAQHRICLLTATPVSMGWKDLYALMRLCGYPKPLELFQKTWIQAFAAAIIPQTFTPSLQIEKNITSKIIPISYHLTTDKKLLQDLSHDLQNIQWYSIHSDAQISEIRLISHILMHRLISHRTACIKTLNKLAKYYQSCRLNHSQQLLTRSDFYKMMGIDGNQRLLPFEEFQYGGISLPETRHKLDNALKFIQSAQKRLNEICKTPDSKLMRLQAYIKTLPNTQKIVIFSQYADTAKYFAHHLKVNRPIALLTANEATLNGQNIAPEILMAMFDPNTSLPNWWEEYNLKSAQILICSDAFSCGHNFQSASVIIHLDLPWNPTTLKQREGRILRKGQISKNVHIVHMNMIGFPNDFKTYQKQFKQKLNHRTRLQNEWYINHNIPLDTNTYLVCSNSQFPTYWAQYKTYWIPVASTCIPEFIKNIFALSHLQTYNKSYPPSTIPPQDNIYTTEITIQTHTRTQLYTLSTYNSSLEKSFYKNILSHAKFLNPSWKELKKWRHLPNIQTHIKTLNQYLFQIATFPQTENINPLNNDSPQHTTSHMPFPNYQPIPSIPLAQTPCQIFHYTPICIE